MFGSVAKFRVPVDLSLAVFTLLVLVGYTYIKFWVVPYTGFYINSSTARVETVYTISNPKQIIKEGDVVVSVEDVNWKVDFRPNLRQALFEDVVPGQTVTVLVQRDGEEESIEWQIPGRNLKEVWGRIVDIWWLAYVFYLAGVATSILIRPKDSRWWLLLLFYYATAVWLLAGTVSSHHIGMSALVLRSTLWLCIPIYIHLHWIFPIPLKKLPVYIWAVIYLGGVTLAVAEWLSLLPINAYFVAALIAMGGTILLIFSHYLLQPKHRLSIMLLAVTVLLAFVPLASIAVISLMSIQPLAGALALITLPALPTVYFYTAYRHPVGWLELRANRIVALYLFLLLLVLLTMLISPLVQFLNLPSDSIMLNVAIVLGASLLTAVSFHPFQHFIEKKLLGIPVRYEQIVERFTTSIITSFKKEQLIQVLQDEIMPSLLIQQSALLQLDQQGQFETLYADGITVTDTSTDLGTLLIEDVPDKHLQSYIVQLLPWVRRVFPLRSENGLIGFWLLGKHAPDNKYRREEISLLKLLAKQISIALTNIQQAEQLRALYKSSIDHQEIEKANLARLLHDEILNNLALLAKAVAEANPQLESVYQSLVTRIRQTVITLRPALLDFGLWAGLDELIDNLNQIHQDQVEILFTVHYSSVRYSVEVEQNLLRIVQLAVENGIEHAEANTILVRGQLEPGYIHCTIADDGVGFLMNAPLDFVQSQNSNHFGLANMHERCKLIEADLQVVSRVGQGTAVTIIWDSREKS